MIDIIALSELSNETYSVNGGAASEGYSYVAGSFDDDQSTGFRASLYFNETSNTLVVAYAGTHPKLSSDIVADIALARGDLPDQASQAVNYATQKIQDFEDDGNSNFNIVYTGHSLGGYLAQHAHLVNENGSAVAFNSPGVNSHTSMGGAIDVTYVFSNPALWGNASLVHSLGSYVGSNDPIYVMDAGGHGILELFEALRSPAVNMALTEEQLIDHLAQQIRDGSLRTMDLAATFGKTGLPEGIAWEAIAMAAECFVSGTLIAMGDGSSKKIELIACGDIVMSFDKDGNLVPGKVTRTFSKDVSVVLNFFGTNVTPGHVYYRADSNKPQKFETLIDILRDDGVIKHQDGTLIRAATNVPVGNARDGSVNAITGTRQADGSLNIGDQGRIRLGTRFLVDGKRSYCVADLIEAAGGVVGDDEMIRIGEGSAMAFHWEFGDTLPKPEDYVLECSGTTLEAIYRAAEWEEGQYPQMPPPDVTAERIKVDQYQLTESAAPEDFSLGQKPKSLN